MINNIGNELFHEIEQILTPKDHTKKWSEDRILRQMATYATDSAVSFITSRCALSNENITGDILSDTDEILEVELENFKAMFKPTIFGDLSDPEIKSKMKLFLADKVFKNLGSNINFLAAINYK